MEIALRRLDGVDKISISISEKDSKLPISRGPVSSLGTFARPWQKRRWRWCGSKLLPEAMSMKKQVNGSLWRAKISFFCRLPLKFPLKARYRSREPSMIRPSLSDCKYRNLNRSSNGRTSARFRPCYSVLLFDAMWSRCLVRECSLANLGTNFVFFASTKTSTLSTANHSFFRSIGVVNIARTMKKVAALSLLTVVLR